MTRFVISGPGGGVVNRLEINTFVKNDKYFSLYIQALRKMLEESPGELQSFFEVGGIHGLPYIPWDDVNGHPYAERDRNYAHDTVLFPTWHRLYVSAFEQILWDRAQEVAQTYSVDQSAWKAAATTLRQPYWDWAAKSIPPPEVIGKTQVHITGPDGKKLLVDNPLYHHKCQPIDSSFPKPYSGGQTTLKHPTSTASYATDDFWRLRAVLFNAQDSIRSKTYNMLHRVTTWSAFSNHTVGDIRNTSNSLEAVHDGIYDLIGGRGHMGDPAVSGFEPIVYLHLCNVDRLLSLWSALHPGVWVTRSPSEDGTFTIPPTSYIDANTDLRPFYNTQTSFWTSAGLTDTSKLGYTYPEFKGLNTSNPSSVQKAIAAGVNKLYGSARFGVSPSRGIATRSAAAQEPIAAAPEGHPYPLDWTARVEFKNFEIGHSFAVVLFLGGVPEKPEDYLISPHYVGAHHAFVNSSTSRCGDRKNQADSLVEGYIHLTRPILEKGKLKSLEAAVVEPYLTKDLHWRVIGVNSTQVEIQSLEVSVFSTPLSYPRGGGAFPVAGRAIRHNGITYGRAGGSREALQPEYHVSVFRRIEKQ